jgi:putative oxidoreductase
MNLVHKIENWGDAHHPAILDVVRSALGIFLFMKGMAFMDNTADLRSIIEAQDTIIFPPSAIMGLVYYVTFAHMVGGIMITLGILTRFSSIIQIPIVLGAVFVNDVLLSPINTQLWYSVVALVLLVIFIIIGSGPFSLDRYFGNISEAEPD